MRVSYEFFMRSVDLLGQLHENAIQCVDHHDAVARPARRGPAASRLVVRGASRELNLPYETVRRHCSRPRAERRLRRQE